MTAHDDRRRVPRALILPDALRPWLGSVMISFSAVWVRLADVEPARSALLRAVYALPLLAVLVLVTRRDAPAPIRRARWMIPGAIVAGFILGIDFIAWHASIEIIGAGLGTVLPQLQVVFVGLAGVVLFRERPPGVFWAALPIVLAGVALIGLVGQPLQPDGPLGLGILLGVVTAVAYAAVLVVLRVTRSRAKVSDGVSALWCLTLGAAVFMAPYSAWQGALGPAGWPADGWLIGLALGSQVVGWFLVTSAIHRMPATATSVALLLQPVLALVWGRVLLDEPIGALQALGAGVVLFGVAIAHRATTALRAAPVRAGPP